MNATAQQEQGKEVAVTMTRKEEAKQELLKLLPKGTTVYTVVRSVAQSGMSRRVDLYVVADGQLAYLTGYVAELLGYSRSRKLQGIRLDGCGMDMCYHVVDCLAWSLYGCSCHSNGETILRNSTI